MTSPLIRGADRFTVPARPWGSLLAVAAAMVLGACSPGPVPLESPAGPGAALPRLTVDGDGAAWLSWVEPAGGGHALKYARLDADGWSDPAEAARGEGWFVNWADFPSVVSAGGGRLAAHWLEKREGGPYAYDVTMAVSTDGGKSWSTPATPHGDGTATEHGFVTLVPGKRGVRAVWLDGRNTAAVASDGDTAHHGGHGGAMTLRAGGLDWSGRPLPETELDPMTCDCCQTGAAQVPAGTLVVYRDRSPEEIRDVYAVALGDAGAGPPAPVARDDWTMPACPVNGPAVEAREAFVAVAWFTAAGDQPRVRLAVSGDGGARFGPVVEIEDEPNLGRVDVAITPDGRPVVSWLALDGKEAVIRYRAVDAGGAPGPVHTLAATSQARSSGLPQMVAADGRLVFAWTDTGEPSRVMTAEVPLP